MITSCSRVLIKGELFPLEESVWPAGGQTRLVTNNIDVTDGTVVQFLFGITEFHVGY